MACMIVAAANVLSLNMSPNRKLKYPLPLSEKEGLNTYREGTQHVVGKSKLTR